LWVAGLWLVAGASPLKAAFVRLRRPRGGKPNNTGNYTGGGEITNEPRAPEIAREEKSRKRGRGRSEHQLRERGETRGTSEKQNGDHNQRGGSTHRNMHKRDVHGRSPPRSGWPKPKSATPSTLGNNERDTGATEGTPEGTYTDEGKEGSAKARTERLGARRHTPLEGL
jgi:hypothetical protein